MMISSCDQSSKSAFMYELFFPQHDLGAANRQLALLTAVTEAVVPHGALGSILTLFFLPTLLKGTSVYPGSQANTCCHLLFTFPH